MIPLKPSDAELQSYVDNIVRTYRAATPAQLARGDQWYRIAHDLAWLIADGNVRRGAGILAVLSANKRWEDNLNLAIDAGNGDVHGHTGVTLDKVRAILDGTDPLEVLPEGLKTWNFFQCICDPDDPDAVVIDRWAARTATGDTSKDSPGLGSKQRYATLALAYRLAARILDRTPQNVQATCWGIERDSSWISADRKDTQ